MGTGIVSVAMLSAGQQLISRVLLAIAAGMWLLLAASFLWRIMLDREGWRADVQRPAALTAVAGTAVLGARLTVLGWSWAGWALLAFSTVLALGLIPAATPAALSARTGASFLVVVGLQSLAVLAAMLGSRTPNAAAAIAALLPFAAGIATYAVLLARFRLAELREGAGDHWVSGGALAISTLGCAQISQALASAHAATWLAHPLRVAALVLWALTVAWLPILLLAELRWRRLGYDVRRWATVFPLGMYAVMSDATGSVGRAQGLLAFGHAWAWVALAAWALVAVGWCVQSTRRVRT